MNAQEYYQQVIGKMKNCFQYSHYVVAAGRELASESTDPIFPHIAVPIDQLEKLTVGRGLQVHLPVVGKQSQTVLMPLDFEIFLEDENHKLYEDRMSQSELFKQLVPLISFLEDFFRSRRLPYLLDYTPSGIHILFQNVLGTRAVDHLKNIGFVEEDLKAACRYVDTGDIRRWYGVSLDAARVFSGLGKIAEYISLVTIHAFRKNPDKGLFPVTISDSYKRCINFDNSWCEGSPFMRTIRSPFCLHKKNQDKYGMVHSPPLVDVIGTEFDGKNIQETTDIDFILDCMWNLEKAAEHGQRFSGIIPSSDQSLIDLLEEYRASPLYSFHQEFDRQPELPRGAAVEKAWREVDISDESHQVLYHPNPLALQPQKMIGFVSDFLLHAHWKPRHIANIFRDLYINPDYNWIQDFYRYPADEKANFWGRTFSAMALMKAGQLML